MKFLSKSRVQTFNIAKKLALKLTGGEIILLSGRMGAGKTVFCKGLAAGLGIKNEVTSPTFTVMNVYGGGRLRLCHCDAYRLRDECGDELGLSDYLGEADVVTVIEWPQNLDFYRGGGRVVEVKIEFLGGNKREIELQDIPKQE